MVWAKHPFTSLEILAVHLFCFLMLAAVSEQSGHYMGSCQCHCTFPSKELLLLGQCLPGQLLRSFILRLMPHRQRQRVRGAKSFETVGSHKFSLDFDNISEFD